MGMLKKEQKAKMEGMQYIGRLLTEAMEEGDVKSADDCVKLINKEIADNGGNPNEFKLTSYELKSIKTKIYLRIMKIIKACILYTLRIKFGFGRNRLVYFYKSFLSICDDIVIGKEHKEREYEGLQLEEIVEQLRYETSIDLDDEDKTIDDDYDWRGYLKTNGYYKDLAKNRKKKK